MTTSAFELQVARAVAAEINALHPRALAQVLYCYGGGYAVVAQSPLPGQDTVVILDARRYAAFMQMRGDAWKRERLDHEERRALAARQSLASVARMRSADHEEQP